MPVLRMEKRLAALPPGQLLELLATDPMAKIDIPLYCRQNGHDCTVIAEGDVLRFSIRKSASSA
jgi:tRNA 2-thiouridine synthesizing protein A